MWSVVLSIYKLAELNPFLLSSDTQIYWYETRAMFMRVDWRAGLLESSDLTFSVFEVYRLSHVISVTIIPIPYKPVKFGTSNWSWNLPLPTRVWYLCNSIAWRTIGNLHWDSWVMDGSARSQVLLLEFIQVTNAFAITVFPNSYQISGQTCEPQAACD